MGVYMYAVNGPRIRAITNNTAPPIWSRAIVQITSKWRAELPSAIYM